MVIVRVVVNDGGWSCYQWWLLEMVDDGWYAENNRYRGWAVDNRDDHWWSVHSGHMR